MLRTQTPEPSAEPRDIMQRNAHASPGTAAAAGRRSHPASPVLSDGILGFRAAQVLWATAHSTAHCAHCPLPTAHCAHCPLPTACQLLRARRQVLACFAKGPVPAQAQCCASPKASRAAASRPSPLRAPSLCRSGSAASQPGLRPPARPILGLSDTEMAVASAMADSAAPQPGLNRADWAAMPSGHRMGYLNTEMVTVLGGEEEEGEKEEDDQHEMGLVQPNQQPEKEETDPIRTAKPRETSHPPPPPHLWVPEACRVPWTQQDDEQLLEVRSHMHPPIYLSNNISTGSAHPTTHLC